jgi:hypothetical protein
VEWESPFTDRDDPGLKSFLFPLKNPHDSPPRKFALKTEKKDRAIECDSQ